MSEQDNKEKFRMDLEEGREKLQQAVQKVNEQTQQARQRLDAQKQETREQVEASAKSSDTDSPFDLIFTEPVGMIFARGFIKMHWTPNAVTLLAMACGVIGGVFLYPRNLWYNLLGVALEILAAVLDASDGQVARLTHQSTEFGRMLDGFCDGLCFGSVYIALACRMMGERIPFTERNWGLWIWPLVLVSALVFHKGQCRMADYYRNVHLFFLKGQGGCELSRASEVLAQRKQAKKAFDVLRLTIYLNYTRLQEARTPKLQKLFGAMRAHPEADLAALSADYVERSRKYIQLTNWLTYNLRAYTLYILLLCGIHAAYFPFLIFVMGGIKLFMICHYEHIAAELTQKYFGNGEKS